MYSKDEVKILKHEFWEGFDRYTQFYAKKIQQPIKWMFYKTGVKGIELKFDVTTKNILVLIEVNQKNENERFERYLELNKYKNIIEEGFADGLIWIDEFIKEEGPEVSRILVKNEELNFHNKDHWSAIYKFMAENMFRLQTNLEDILPILKEKFNY